MREDLHLVSGMISHLGHEEEEELGMEEEKGVPSRPKSWVTQPWGHCVKEDGGTDIMQVRCLRNCCLSGAEKSDTSVA